MASATQRPGSAPLGTGRRIRGKVRPNNEDSFLCLQFDALELRYLGKIGEADSENVDFVFAVSDGMGGARAGEFASRVAVDKITRLLPPTFKRSAAGLTIDFDDVLEELFSEIHKALTYLGCSDAGLLRHGRDPEHVLVYPGLDVFRPYRRQQDLLFAAAGRRNQTGQP